MIPLGVLGSAHVAAGGAEVTLTDTKTGSNTSVSETVDVGSAHADRWVIVVFTIISGLSRYLNSDILNINGTNRTVAGSQSRGGVVIAAAHVPTGTTATVSGTINNYADWDMRVYAIPTMLTLADTEILQSDGIGTTFTGSLTPVTAGDVVFVAATWGAGAITLSGASVEDVSQTNRRVGRATVATSPHSVGFSIASAGSAGYAKLVAAAFTPA